MEFVRRGRNRLRNDNDSFDNNEVEGFGERSGRGRIRERMEQGGVNRMRRGRDSVDRRYGQGRSSFHSDVVNVGTQAVLSSDSGESKVFHNGNVIGGLDCENICNKMQEPDRNIQSVLKVDDVKVLKFSGNEGNNFVICMNNKVEESVKVTNIDDEGDRKDIDGMCIDADEKDANEKDSDEVMDCGDDIEESEHIVIEIAGANSRKVEFGNGKIRSAGGVFKFRDVRHKRVWYNRNNRGSYIDGLYTVKNGGDQKDNVMSKIS